MADKSNQLILDALSRSAADPTGLPLYGNKSKPGLFTATAAARQAARRCQAENWLRVVGTEQRGKTAVDICSITDKGLSYLLSQANPKQVLDDLVRALEDRQQKVGALVAAAHQTEASLGLLRATAEKVLQAVGEPSRPAAPTNGNVKHTNGTGEHGTANGSRMLPGSWQKDVTALLDRWRTGHVTEDCSLPELYRRVREAAPRLTIGEFHDGLRQLHEERHIYLHPWTGPLHDVPEPALALLVGHEIAYYASVRK